MRSWMRGLGVLALALGSSSVLPACASGSAEKKADPVGDPAAMSSGDSAAHVDRIDDINRICQRKAGIAVPRCWNDEYQRTGKKFEAQVTLMIVVNPAGTAEDVKVIGSTASSKELLSCLIDQAKSWTYPEGKASTHVNCSFFLRSSM